MTITPTSRYRPTVFICFCIASIGSILVYNERYSSNTSGISTMAVLTHSPNGRRSLLRFNNYHDQRSALEMREKDIRDKRSQDIIETENHDTIEVVEKDITDKENDEESSYPTMTPSNEETIFTTNNTTSILEESRCQDVVQSFIKRDRWMSERKLQARHKAQARDYNSFQQGSTHLFWKDFMKEKWGEQLIGSILSQSTIKKKPLGDKATWTWVSGDLSLFNFETFDNRHGDVVLGTGDFDNAAIYDFQIDILRFAVSIYEFATDKGLKEIDIKDLLTEFNEKYIQSVLGYIDNEDANLFSLSINTVEKGKLQGFFEAIEERKKIENHLEAFTEKRGEEREFLKGSKQSPHSTSKLAAVSESKDKEIRSAFSTTKYGSTTMKIGWNINEYSSNTVPTILDIAARVDDSDVASIGLYQYFLLLESTSFDEPIILNVKQQPSPAVMMGDGLSTVDAAWYATLFSNSAERTIIGERQATAYADEYTGWIFLKDDNGNPQPYSIRRHSPWKEKPVFIDKIIDSVDDLKLLLFDLAKIVSTSHVRGSVAKYPGDFKHVIKALFESPKDVKEWITAVSRLANTIYEQSLIDYDCFRNYVKNSNFRRNRRALKDDQTRYEVESFDQDGDRNSMINSTSTPPSNPKSGPTSTPKPGSKSNPTPGPISTPTADATTEPTPSSSADQPYQTAGPTGTTSEATSGKVSNLMQGPTNVPVPPLTSAPISGATATPTSTINGATPNPTYATKSIPNSWPTSGPSIISASSFAEVTERCDYVTASFTERDIWMSESGRRKRYEVQSETFGSYYRSANHIFWLDFVRRNLGENLLAPIINGTTFAGNATFSRKSVWTWVSGDQHLYNFGAYGNRMNNVVVGMNDFDEAAIFDFQIDILRVMVSALSRGFDYGIKEVIVKKKLRLFATVYISTVIGYVSNENANFFEIDSKTAKGEVFDYVQDVADDEGYDRQIDKFLVTGREVFKKGTLDAPHHKSKLAAIDPIREKEIRDAFTATDYGSTMLHLGWNVPLWTDDHFYTVLDVAVRISGTGSYGVDRYYVLLKDSKTDELVILDVKQQTEPSIRRTLSNNEKAWFDTLFPNAAKRVVQAEREMTSYVDPFTGWVYLSDASGEMQPFSIRRRSYYKKKAEKLLDYDLDAHDFSTILRNLAQAAATAHVRGSVAKSPSSFKMVIATLFGGKDGSKNLNTWMDGLIQQASSLREQTHLDYECFLTFVNDNYR